MGRSVLLRLYKIRITVSIIIKKPNPLIVNQVAVFIPLFIQKPFYKLGEPVVPKRFFPSSISVIQIGVTDRDLGPTTPISVHFLNHVLQAIAVEIDQTGP